MSFVVGTALLAVVTALACALPGVFVVLRKNSMLVDAISHAILPGIVVGYFFTHNLDSPLLILGAALAGLVVVLGSEWLTRTGLLTGDAPQGLIFPALFAGGVIMVTMNFANIHLDTHAVLVGDLNLAAWQQLMIGDVSIGPSYLYVMLGVLAVNVVFLAAFYPKLAITTFDTEFATSLGIRASRLNTAFMFLVSLTVTAAFHAAGAILVLALMIVPPATAYLAQHPALRDDRVDGDDRCCGGAGGILAGLRAERGHQRGDRRVLRTDLRRRVSRRHHPPAQPSRR